MKSQTILHPGVILKRHFEKRKLKNPRFSLRSLAKLLEVSPTFLSLLFQEKRMLSESRIHRISNTLRFSPEERTELLEAAKLINSSAVGAKFKGETLEAFKEFEDHSFLLSKWYYIAILDLVTCANFTDDTNWIAARLGITPKETTDAIDKLLQVGFLQRDATGIKKTNLDLYLNTTQSLESVRKYHQIMSEKAVNHMHSHTSLEDFSKRSFTGMSIAVNPKNLSKAKAMIARFEAQISRLLSDGDCEEVYHLGVHLSPVTKHVA